MKYIFYPQENTYESIENQIEKKYLNAGGYVGEFFNSLAKKRKTRWVYTKIVAFLNKLADEDDLTNYYKIKTLYCLGNSLYEMRIPKVDSKGVSRIYYCYSRIEEQSNTLVLLEGELKKTKKGQKIDVARKYLNQYRETLDKEKK